MKLLLSSGGIQNASLHAALEELLGKPVAESTALCIPTAVYASRDGTQHAYNFVTGHNTTPLCDLGWQSLGLLELSALTMIEKDQWVPRVRDIDALLVGGGDPLFLHHWMRASGLADLFASLDDVTYVGVSAGSMVMAPRIGEDFVKWRPAGADDRTLGVVDFSIFPHLDHEMLPENTMRDAEQWAQGMDVPCYAIDDATALRVVGGTVEVITEGHWRRFDP